MGPSNSAPQKMLLMTFDDSYLPKLSKLIINRPIAINNSIGFYTCVQGTSNMIYTFLSATARKIWCHHYLGTEGIVMVFEGEDTAYNLLEVLTILNSDYLRKVPLLLLLDQSNASKTISQITQLRLELIKMKVNFKVQYINFENYSQSNDIGYGVEWLMEHMV